MNSNLGPSPISNIADIINACLDNKLRPIHEQNEQILNNIDIKIKSEISSNNNSIVTLLGDVLTNDSMSPHEANVIKNSIIYKAKKINLISHSLPYHSETPCNPKSINMQASNSNGFTLNTTNTSNNNQLRNLNFNQPYNLNHSQYINNINNNTANGFHVNQ